MLSIILDLFSRHIGEDCCCGYGDAPHGGYGGLYDSFIVSNAS
jgi:hypothetical protein